MYKQPNRTMIKIFHLFVTIALLAASLAALAPPRPARAATTRTITVSSASDSESGGSSCTLRDAISAANAGATGTYNDCTITPSGSGDPITYVLNLPSYTYTLTITGSDDTNAAGDLDITSEVTINGAGAGSTIIQAGDTDSNGIDRVFHVVSSSGNLTLEGVTVRHGRVTGSRDGGGIYNDHGTLTLNNSTLSGNSAGNYGGGMFNYGGTVTVDNSTLSDNSAVRGGGIRNYRGTVTVDNSTLSDNSASEYGGGVFNYDGTTTLNNSTLSGNRSNYQGGGISTYLGTVSLAHCTLTDNIANNRGGGIHRDAGTVKLKNSIVAGNADNASYSNDDCYGSITSQGYNLVGAGTGCPSGGTGDQTTSDPKLGPLQDNGGPTETHALLSVSPALDAIPDETNGCGTDYTSDQRGETRPQPQGGACDVGAYEFDDYAYWDGGGTDNNTSTAENWSDNTLPTTSDIVVFGSPSSKDATVNGDLIVSGWTITSDYTGAITQGSHDLTVSGHWTQSGGTFNGGSGTLDLGSDFDLSDGAFTAPSGLMSVGGGWTQSGGTFTHNDGAVTFDGSGTQTFTGTTVFYDVTVGSGSTLQLAANSDWGYAGAFTLDGGFDAATNTPNTVRLAGGETQTLPAGATTLHSLAINSGATLSAPAALNVTGDWTNNGTFTHNDGTVTFDGSGAQTLSGTTTFYNLTVNSGATLVDESDLSVDGVLTNNGTLQKTQDVNGIADVNFFHTGGYGGLTLNANGANLGSTTVKIRGNDEYCTTTAGETVRRCFDVSPTNTSGRSADITFYFAASELSGNTCTALTAYRWNESSDTWQALTTGGHACSVEPYSAQATGVSDFSPFVLKEGAPAGDPLGATITVNSTTDAIADDGNCTLREAITAANTDTASGSTTGECAAGNGAGTDLIILPADTYTFASGAGGDLDINSEITINGAGAATTIIQAGATGSNGVDRVFDVHSNGDLTLDGVTVRHGKTSLEGGGIYNDHGTLTLNNSILSNNNSTYNYGGGVYNKGTVNVGNSTLSDNSAVRGGGVFNDYGTVNVDNSTLSDNSASEYGGGMSNYGGTVNVDNSTFSDNSADDGGGINTYEGTVILAHCTLTDNTANNRGGGIHWDYSGTVKLKNSIVAGNADNASYSDDDCYGSITSEGYNLVGDGTGCPSDGTGDQTTSDPKLGPLQDNGGPTETHALLSGSPALDAIPDEASGCGTDYTSDQRGSPRPMNGSCDAGAYEAGAVWDGGGADANWSTAINWLADFVPAATDFVVFDDTSDANATLDAAFTIAGLFIDAGYDGAVNAGSYDLTVDGPYEQSGGTFTAPSGLMSVAGGFHHTGGAFDPNGGRVVLDNVSDQTLGTAFYDLVINDGLLGYWKLDEGTGTTTADSSGYGHNGTLQNDPTWSTDTPATMDFPDPYALSFDGTDDHVDIGTDFARPETAFTYALWFQPGSTWTASSNRKDLLYGQSGARPAVIFNFGGAGMITLATEIGGSEQNNIRTVDTTSWSDGTWYHLAFTWDGSQAIVYVNGVQDGDPHDVSGTHAASSGMSIGAKPNGDNPMDGRIDDVRVYNRALSATEIQALANGEHPTTSIATTTLGADLDVNGALTLNSGTLAQSQFKGYWKFDDGSGATASDSSGNGHDGTLTNMAEDDWVADPASTTFSNTHALDFDGTDDRVLIGADFARPEAAFTYALWFKPGSDWNSSSGRKDLLYGQSYARPTLIFNRENDGKIGLYTRIGGVDQDEIKTTTTSWAPGTWYHIAFTWDGSQVIVYVNGAQEGSPYAVSGTQSASSGMSIGAQPGGSNPVDGRIDDVRVYSRALSETEVQALADSDDVHAYDITIAGDFVRNGGVFEAGKGIVTFDGSGTQNLDTDAITFYNLTVDNGSTLVDLADFTVDGTLTNNGALQQTQEVNGSNTVFLNVKDSGGSQDKYFGLEINPGTSDMDSTTVTIYGNQTCSDAPNLGKDPIQRCFYIEPTTPLTATVKLYYLTSELNGNTASTLNIYHEKNNLWYLEGGTYTRESDGDTYDWVQVTGVDEYSPFTAGNHEDATLLELASFTATAQDGYVLVEWETASEIDNEGFNLWRSETRDGPYVQLNAALIPAQGGPITGASYGYVDDTVINGVTYYYKLEDVDTYGVGTFHGPVSATPSRVFRVYLPLILSGVNLAFSSLLCYTLT